MPMTPYHARYLAMLLSRRASEADVSRYLPALMSASIDLHPHQIDAALFACRSQFQDGVILADEEGLGKTIEAGIALKQAQIEGKTHLLVLCPVALLVHWQKELDEKFSLTAAPLDREGDVTLLSYPEAHKRTSQLADIPWDLCVLDEAHQLANAGLGDHVLADSIREALKGRRKLLLTATPMQNTLLDLYFLIRFVDDTAFGSDPEVFRQRYMGNKLLKQELASRAQIICQRTLKRQALTMQLPRRVVRTIAVEATPEEDALSKNLSLYFHREHLAAFPKIQEHYIRLTYWKLLASSTAALRDSLAKLLDRLARLPNTEDELQQVKTLIEQADAVPRNARATAFLTALDDAMKQLKTSGAPPKAVIFSENRRTLAYIAGLLNAHGYEGQIATYGQPDALEAFADGTARILLATDSLSVGANLSHCALVINYDLPWNVQKLEQRISRCHRYGQKHDVLVINFIDPGNRADRRLYELLNKKLKAFDDVFGASEGVLIGQLDDLRSPPELEAEQSLFAEQNRVEIDRRMQKAEADLLAHFDEDVRARFLRYGERLPQALSQMEQWLWDITKYKLSGRAVIDDARRRVIVDKSPYKGLRLSRIFFGMDKALPKPERYRLDHPLARRVLEDCLNGELQRGTLLLEPGDGFFSGMSGDLAVWQVSMLSGTTFQTHPLLCGAVRGGLPLTQPECQRLLSLPVISFTGGAVWRDDEDEEPHKAVEAGAALEAQKDAALADLRQRLIAEQDEPLQAELSKLRRWAEDELTALSMRQEKMQARIAKLQDGLASAATFAERLERNKELAALEKQRREEETRLLQTGARVNDRRDALMETAREKSAARFWDTLMFVIQFRIHNYWERLCR